MGMHLLKSRRQRIGKGCFEIAVACACKHLETERETGQTLQPWCSGSPAQYMAAFRGVRDAHGWLVRPMSARSFAFIVRDAA